jgi:hypothetical protein
MIGARTHSLRKEVNKISSFGMQATLCKLCLAATAYHLWKQMNDLCHRNTPRTEENIIVQIKWQVRMRILYKGQFKKTTLNENLASIWSIQSML